MKLPCLRRISLLMAACASAAELPPPVTIDQNGVLEYPEDADGNRLIDFSHAGYAGGGVAIPTVLARVIVTPGEGDDGARIQAAIEHVSGLAPDAVGLRGAVQLAPGRYEVAGQLRITRSGVVLRGSGRGEDGSVIVASGKGRRTLIEIAGTVLTSPPGEALRVADERVAVGAMRLRLASTEGLRVGSRIASLYRAQLAARLGQGSLAVLEARPLLQAASDLPEVPVSPVPEPEAGKALSRVDGVLKIGDQPLSGSNLETAWWRGRLESSRAAETGPALTRFAPGLVGPGLTDDLDSVAAGMLAGGQVLFRHHPGLWYDSRRDDHQMTRRIDAEVWPPFYEQPFARSGQGKAWNGLSRYDLTRYNPWYFGRLHDFARISRAKGLVLLNEMYFQHNILESGAHWVDSPWRPVNNINATGFTEPPPLQGRYHPDGGRVLRCGSPGPTRPASRLHPPPS